MTILDHLIAEQLRLPKGLWGKLTGRQMAKHNRKLIEWSLELLAIQPTDCFLEIGFGPGLGIQHAVKMNSRGRVAGIELSKTMLKEASRLNAKAIAAGRV